MCPADEQSNDIKQEAEAKLNRRDECLQTVCSVFVVYAIERNARLRASLTDLRIKSIECVQYVRMCQAQRLVRCGDFAQAIAQVEDMLNAFPQNDPLAKCREVCANNKLAFPRPACVI